MLTVLGLIAWYFVCRWLRNQSESNDTDLSDDPTDFSGWDGSDYVLEDFHETTVS